MIFLGVGLTIGFFIVFSVLTGAVDFLWQPWYLFGVIVLTKCALLTAHGIKAQQRACLACLSPAKADAETRQLAAAYFTTGKKAAIGAGWVTTIFGIIAVLAGGTPPEVAEFSYALTGIGYGVLWAYGVFYPIARAFKSGG